MGIAEEMQLANRSSSSALVLSRDSIDNELSEELKDLFTLSLAALADAADLFGVSFLDVFSEVPVDDPELPDLPTADGRGR